MSNNITLKKITRDSGAYEAGVTFETEQQAGGEHRPVVKPLNSMLDVPFSTSTVQAVGSTDVSAYRGVAVQINTQGTSSTVTFQGSNDNINWVSVALTISTSVTTAPVVSTTAASSYYGPLHFRYFRLNVTGIASGTTDGVICFSTNYSHTAPVATAVTLAAAATNVAKAEDSAAASANVGIPPLVVRADTLSANAGVSANGDYAFMFCDNTGQLYTTAAVTSSALPTGAATYAAQTDGSQRAGILGFRSSDSTYQPLRLDRATNSIQTIDYAHHEAHAGSAYYYHDVIALANAAAQDYLLTTANTTTWPHFGLEIDFNDGAGTIELYEAADRTGTTLQTTFNRDRNSANTAGMTIHKGQSGGTTDGSRILWKRDGAGKTSGGTSGTAEERILKQNTKYILRITNVAGAGVTNNITVILRWYEHANIA